MPDTNAFARIDLAQSTSANDISDYLLQIKRDLKIGELGFPQELLVIGDQQTYSIVKKIKYNDPHLFKVFPQSIVATFT